jgi:hypothetical protein
METRKNSIGKEKSQTGRKIVAALVVLIIFVVLFLAARFLVGSVDIVELIKKMHGG